VGFGNGGAGDTAALGAEPTSPRPASPADLASIGARVARELVYPALARRRQWQGRALVAFTLRADGSVGAIEIRESSGHPLLDEEAQRAIRRAAPFPAPGVELLVVVPVTFQLR
jgi:protein TonB